MKGIYSIECVENKRVYIGRSTDIEKRWKNHKIGLLSGKHINKELQNDYKAFGIDSFVFTILKETDLPERHESLIYYDLKDKGISLYNKAGIIDYRVIDRSEALELGRDIVSRCEKALIERSVDKHEWLVSDLAKQLGRSETETIIAIRDYLYTESSYEQYKYIVRLNTHYTTHYLSFMLQSRIDDFTRNFSL